MANINDAFPSNYLKASDLQGSQPIVTIDKVGFEPVGQEKEMKPVLYFVGKEKGMVLNKTNAKNISHLIGSFETNDWVGFRIRLYSANVEFKGDMVESIRVKAAPPQNGNGPAPVPVPVQPAPAQHIDEDSIPF